MAYLLLAICILYTLLWGAGFLFSLRSKGAKQPVIPLVGLALFVVLGAYSGQRSMETMKSPHLLTVESYGELKKDMSLEEVEDLFGAAQADSRDDYDLGASGIRIHPHLSDLLGSKRHKERTKALLAIRIDGRAGPMGANLTRVDGLYKARVAAWDRGTKKWEARMGRLFADQAKMARKDAAGWQAKADGTKAALAEAEKLPETDETDDKIDKLEEQLAVQTDVAQTLDLLAQGYASHAKDPSYEKMHLSMLLSDSEGVIIRDAPWLGDGCRQVCNTRYTEQDGVEVCEGGKEWDCPLVDLHKGLIPEDDSARSFATIDSSGKVTHPAYRQSDSRLTVVYVDAVEGGFGGAYKSTRKVHTTLAAKTATTMALPPEPPELGLAGWATTECHAKDVEDGVVLASDEPELPTIQPASDDENSEEEEEEEEVESATKGVLGLQIAMVEPGANDKGSETLLIEGHLCEEGFDRLAPAPNWAAEQPGADDIWTDDEILGFRECKAIVGGDDGAKSCCSSLKGSWDSAANSCTGRRYKADQLASFRSMFKAEVGDKCMASVSSMVKKINSEGKGALEDLLAGMVHGDLYDCEKTCPDGSDDDETTACSWECDATEARSLDEFGGALLDVVVRDGGGWAIELERDDDGKIVKSKEQLIQGVCEGVLGFHKSNAETSWDYTHGSDRPAWAGAMVCDDDATYASYISDLKSRAAAYLPDGEQESVGDTRACVWWYTDGMRKKDIQETLVKGLTDHANDTYSAQLKSKIQVSHAAERNYGLKGNESYGVIKTGANKAAMVTFGASSQSENFTGGKPAATLKIWEEKGVVMDSDFSGDDRLVVGGFIDGELAMWRESGILADEQKLTIKSVIPSSGAKGESFEITIEGNALQSVKKVTIGSTVVEHESSDDGTIITAQVPGTLKESVHNVEVESSGLNTATLINGIRIGMEEIVKDKKDVSKKASGCSSRPSVTPIGGLALMSLMGVLLGLRRRG